MSTKPVRERDFQEVVNEHAHRCIESMKDDLDALDHAQECSGRDEDGEECKRGYETRPFKLKDGTTGQQCIHENPEVWHDEDAARRVIEEAPLSLEVRSDWHTPGGESEDTEYCLLLGTGGPATRIVGKLEHGAPDTANFEYQDWFKPWTAANNLSMEERDTLLRWAQQFYFGE